MPKSYWRAAALAVAVSAPLFGAAATARAQSASFEAKNFPITLHQAQVTGLADIREHAPAPALTSGGMPASPNQVAVLTPRVRLVQAGIADAGNAARPN